MAVLPTVGGSTGTWGTELNTWLLVAHNPDGTLKSGSAPPSGLSLPTVGGSAGTWGSELNAWLLVSHNPDGTLKSGSAPPSGLSLPTVGGSAGTWGNELNTWLLVAHNPDGTLKNVIVPPSEFVSPIGRISNRAPGYFPPTNIEKYGVISSEGPAPGAFRGVNIVYRSQITASVGYTNITEAEARANGWVLHNGSGAELTNSIYGGVLCDPGNLGYQQRWIEASMAYAQAHDSDSFWIDDSTPKVGDFFGGGWPAERPTSEAYRLACVSFAQAVKSACAAVGMPNATYNNSISLDDNAAQLMVWLDQIGPHIGGHCVEYWMQANGGVRLRGSNAWYNYWDAWRGPHQKCNQLGIRFDPVPYESSSPGGLAYILGTYMLDWEPSAGGSLLWSNPDASGTVDFWNSFCTAAYNLGYPTAASVEISTGIHRRQYENGTVTVNSNNGTATIP